MSRRKKLKWKWDGQRWITVPPIRITVDGERDAP